MGRMKRCDEVNGTVRSLKSQGHSIKGIVRATGYLPTGWLDAAGAVWGGSRCNEGLRGLLKADSLVA